ncbi:MAG: hypothetical protein AABX02_04490 [archaeon]
MAVKEKSGLDMANQKFKVGLMALLVIMGVAGLYYWTIQPQTGSAISQSGVPITDTPTNAGSVSITDEAHAADVTVQTGQSTAGSESTIDDILNEMAN